MLNVYSSLSFEHLDARFWDQFQKSKCVVEQSCPCESQSSTIFIQPYNVITSLPSLILGIYILTKFRWRIKALGLAFIFTSLGSVLLHASLTRLGQIADFSGIALIFAWILLHINIKGNRRLFWESALITIFIYASFYYFISIRYYVVFIIIALITITSIKKKPGLFFNHKRISLFALTSLLIGFVLFRMDLNRVFCPEFPMLQGHPIWHVLVFISQSLFVRNIYLEEINLQEVS